MFAVILTVIIFSGCKPVFPLDKDQFDLGDTVDIRVGETLYESDSIWVRLDSITKDTRIPAYLSIADTGYVEAYFTFGLNDSVHSIPFCYNLEGRDGGRVTEGYGYLGGSFWQQNMGIVFYFLMTNLSPAKCNDDIFEQWQYKISFMMRDDLIWH